MSLSIGIVGLPNVGKSTLFNALLKQNLALAANYPFATIEPNLGIAAVPDERLAMLAPLVGTTILKPATIEFVDIAGLVQGASQGEGLGNQFLSHIKATHAIAHVLRVFTNPEIIRDQPVNPSTDLQIVRLELQLADLAVVERQTPPKGSSNDTSKKRWSQIIAFKDCLNANHNLTHYLSTITSHQERQLAQNLTQELNLLTSKPEIFVLNVAEADLAQSTSLTSHWAKTLAVDPQQIVIVSAKVESELTSLSEIDQQSFLAELGVKQSGLDRLAQVAYQTLKLQSFLTAGALEVRAWTIPQGTLAPDAAAVIHTDFRQKFIKAKVCTFADFIKYRGWKDAAAAGKVRFEGKDYLMQPNDIVEFILAQ